MNVDRDVAFHCTQQNKIKWNRSRFYWLILLHIFEIRADFCKFFMTCLCRMQNFQYYTEVMSPSVVPRYPVGADHGLSSNEHC